MLELDWLSLSLVAVKIRCKRIFFMWTCNPDWSYFVLSFMLSYFLHNLVPCFYSCFLKIVLMKLKDPVVYLKSPVWDFWGGPWLWNCNWTETELMKNLLEHFVAKSQIIFWRDSTNIGWNFLKAWQVSWWKELLDYKSVWRTFSSRISCLSPKGQSWNR